MWQGSVISWIQLFLDSDIFERLWTERRYRKGKQALSSWRSQLASGSEPGEPRTRNIRNKEMKPLV